tara:strand:+ start:444 stop:2498 length:2055 start_codon:yes stop_codon:yes gene_type:complete
MGGYIGAKTGTLVASASDIRGDISATDTTPEITLKNTTETDADGTRSGKITFKGEQSGGEESVLAQIQGSHDGTADDEKGDLIFKTNDGNDALAPTERLRINSAGDVLVSSPDPSLTITNTTEEDSDGGRESTIVFKGEQSGGELSTLAEIEASHDGTADDEKGDLIFRTNDGSDGSSPTERLRIDSAGSIIPATLGTDNVHLGESAGVSIASGGDNNTLVGKDAGTAITTGDRNTAIGKDALKTATTAQYNTAIGYQALENNTGNNNTAVGDQALEANTSGINNTAVGDDALVANTTGGGNVAIGVSALDANTTASNSTAVGFEAGTNSTGAQNTFFGRQSGKGVTSGTESVFVGNGAGRDGTSIGDYNIGIGSVCLNALTQGHSHVAIGRDALSATTTGSESVAVGYQAGMDNTTGRVVAVGRHALKSNTTGTTNTAVGYRALRDCTTGNDNVAMGNDAMRDATTAVRNTCFGHAAGINITTGNDNTFFGYEAGVYQGSVTTGNHNVIVGPFSTTTTSSTNLAFGLGYNLDCEGGYTTIGNQNADSRLSHGGTTWSTVSDERYKKDITDSTVGLSFINALQPRTFNYKNKGELPDTFRAYEEGSTEVFKSDKTQHGFIAQEVKAAIDADSGVKDGFKLWDDREDGSQEVAEAALIPVLVKALQELSAKNDALEARIETLEAE